MNIRLETPQDYREVENLTRKAFWTFQRKKSLSVRDNFLSSVKVVACL